jgi:hypothetical protein
MREDTDQRDHLVKVFVEVAEIQELEDDAAGIEGKSAQRHNVWMVEAAVAVRATDKGTRSGIDTHTATGTGIK